MRSNVSQNWVDKTFRQILDEMSVSVNSVEVVVDSSELEAQVSFDQTRHVKLEYRNRFFRTLTEDEIVSVLSHEACHVAILPHTLYFGGPSDFVDWQSTFIDIFDEFLAHEEFYSRFKDTPTLSAYIRVKTMEIANYTRILQTVQSGLISPQFGLFRILNDAIFFPIVRSHAFFQWCASNKVSNTNQVLEWILEDCRHVKSLSLSREDAMRAVIEIARFWAGVNARSLLLLDEISLLETIREAEEDVRIRYPEIVEKWRSRRADRERQ